MPQHQCLFCKSVYDCKTGEDCKNDYEWGCCSGQCRDSLHEQAEEQRAYIE